MSVRMARVLRLLVLGMLPLVGHHLAAESLDQQAWNEVNNRLAAYIPVDGQYKVHFPPQSMFALWHDQNNLDSLRNLAQVAGSIPPWGPSWQIGGGSFAERYADVVAAIDFPPAPEVSLARKNKALKDYEAARKALARAVEHLRKERDLEAERRKRQGLPFTLQDKLVWWGQNSGSLTTVSIRFDDAIAELQEVVDPNWPLRGVWDRVFRATKGAANNPEVAGILPYDGSPSQLAAHIKAGKDAHETSSCATSWIFNKDTRSQDTSRSSWGASGSYGPFISVSGGSSSFSDAVSEAGTQVELRFCSLNFIPVQPHQSWYSGSVLDQLKRGQLKINPASKLYGTTLFGRNGYLSRIPVGVLVAFRPSLTAKLATRYRSVMEQSWSARGGIGFGPFKIGGRGGGSRREERIDNQDGSFTFVGAGDEPYIIAVVSRELP